jgi:thiamine-phosphate pyrophosphorylase
MRVMLRSDLTHVDYIGVGPIYPTPSKHDAHTPVGPEMIATFKEMNPQLPIVATFQYFHF